MRRLGLALLWALQLLLIAHAAHAQRLEIPTRPTAWVTDRSGIISTDQQNQLNQKLEAFAKRSGSQILVYVFPTLGEEALEDYTIRVAEQWHLKEHRGLIIFVFLKEHKVRIEVGYGLEGVIPDAVAIQVISNVMAPKFRKDDYFGGLSDAVDVLTARIEGRESPIPLEAPQGVGGKRVGGSDLLPFIIIVLIIFFVVLPMLRRRGGGGCGGCWPLFLPFGGGGGGGTTFGGGGGGGGGWSVGGGWGGGGGGSFGGGGASGGW